jgi:hypothetical protein
MKTKLRFLAIIGYRDLGKLAGTIEHDLAPTVVPSPTKEVASSVAA